MVKQTCFLIDDDADDRELFCMALKDAVLDYECITAENGLEGIEVLNTGGVIPSYIFVDLNMPYMSGIECLQEIKKDPDLANIPLIIYTTSSNPTDIEKTRELGAAHYLIKPPSLMTLVEQLTDIFSKKKLPYVLTTTGKPSQF